MHPNDVCLEDVQFSYCFVTSSLPGGGGGGVGGGQNADCLFGQE